MAEVNPNQIQLLANYLSFKKTWIYEQFVRSPEQILVLFSGNRAGKTSGVIHQYVSRIYGWHPVVEKNFVYLECPRCGKTYAVPSNYTVPAEQRMPPDMQCGDCRQFLRIHDRSTNVYRFMSPVLPTEKGKSSDKGEDMNETNEIKNAIYPALKHWLPSGDTIVRDVTFRSPSLVVRDPFYGHVFGCRQHQVQHANKEIVFEFMGYSQEVQAGGGVDRNSVFADEEIPRDHYEEQLPRLVREKGDFIMGVTAAKNLTWTYDGLLNQAGKIVRSKTICDFLNSKNKGKAGGRNFEQIETVPSQNKNIVAFQSAMDDNPVLDKEAIETLMEPFKYDQEIYEVRRYGIHRQSSGLIFPGFTPRVHVIDEFEWFDGGRMFNSRNWLMARLIDYHERNNWAIPFVALSPTNEMFVWHELSPSPVNMTTGNIADDVIQASGQYYFKFNLIDPLAKVIQSNTNRSAMDEINRIFHEAKVDGRCAGGFFRAWDTKDTKGRDALKERLANSLICERPFNNKRGKNGTCLPTIWIWRCCPETAKSLANWRWQTWNSETAALQNEKKEKPAQPYSHFCTALEGILKEIGWKPIPEDRETEQRRNVNRFQGRRHASICC